MPTQHTHVCLEHSPERSAWGYAVISDGTTVRQQYGVSCHPDRAAIWLLLALFADTKDVEVVVRGDRQTLSSLEEQIKYTLHLKKENPHHDLLEKLKGCEAIRHGNWQLVLEDQEKEPVVFEQTLSALNDFSLRFNEKDVQYVMLQLNKITEPPELKVEEPKTENPVGSKSQVTGYVDAIGEHHLSAWAFVLFDDASGQALFRSSGIRVPYTSVLPIVGLIEMFSCFKQSHLNVEIRCRTKNVVDVFSRPLPDSMDSDWLEENNLTDSDAPHIWHLSSLLNGHTICWVLLEDEHGNELTDTMMDLAERSLVALNSGEPHRFEHRVTKNMNSLTE